MGRWRLTEEPGLEDLLDDKVIEPVMRSAGVDPVELRRQLSEVAYRLVQRDTD